MSSERQTASWGSRTFSREAAGPQAEWGWPTAHKHRLSKGLSTHIQIVRRAPLGPDGKMSPREKSPHHNLSPAPQPVAEFHFGTQRRRQLTRLPYHPQPVNAELRARLSGC